MVDIDNYSEPGKGARIVKELFSQLGQQMAWLFSMKTSGVGYAGPSGPVEATGDFLRDNSNESSW